MVIVEISGGLGNQMFQYAAGKALSLDTKQELKLDISLFAKPVSGNTPRNYDLDVFNIANIFSSELENDRLIYQKATILKRISYPLRKKGKPFGRSYICEKSYHFSSLRGIKKEVYLKGYWQSYKYFSMYEETIRTDFTPKNDLSHVSKNYLEEVRQCNSVSLHVRRGDYVTNANACSYHGLCGMEYYKNAIKEFTDSPHFFIFSDDLNWARENFSFLKNKTLVEGANSLHDYEEMALMSNCKHNIIANSSFSWWGAWLNRNNKKVVIAPEKWFLDDSIDTTDLIPQSWKRL